jgi:hypothetical protein
MGRDANRKSEMNRLWSHLTLLLAQMLDPAEREIALGDIAELGFAGQRAFAGMLGLVVRRQMQAWKHARPWLVLFALVFPLATLLAFASNELSAQLFPQLILWSQHGTYATGVTGGAEIFRLCLEMTAILVASASFGFAVGALSPNTCYVDSLLFCLTLIMAMSAPVTPFSLMLFCCSSWGILPVVLAVFLILAPGFYGLRGGAAASTVSLRGLILLGAGTGVIAVLTAWAQGWDAAAMENWSHAGSALTLIQLLKSETAWAGARSYLPAIFLATSPALYLLVNRILPRDRPGEQRG